jgi:cytoskeleton protein RodZ
VTMHNERTHTMHRDIGAALTAARERLGLTLEDLAVRTKLSQSNIAAIEHGDFDKLGPLVYVRGFVRSYAREVRMSDDWISAQMELLGAHEHQPELLPSSGERSGKTDVAERGMLAASYLVGTMILLSAAYFVTQFDRFFPGEKAPAISQTQTAPVANPPADASAPAIENAPTTTVATEAGTTVASPEAASIQPLPLPAPNPQTTLNAVAAGMTALPQLPPTETTVVQVTQGLTLDASDTVWVEIVDANGRRLEYNNIAAGQRRSYDGVPPYAIKIGNASKVKLSANGQSIDLAPFTRDSVARLRVQENQGAWQGVSN